MDQAVQHADPARQLDRDRDVFRMLIEGVPVHEIADELKCGIADVYAAQHRMCGGVTEEFKVRIVEIDLARLEALHRYYYKLAITGDKEAAALCTRFMDRRSKYCGTDTLPRGDAAVDESREPSSFEKVHEMIMRISKKGPMIDGEVVEESN